MVLLKFFKMTLRYNTCLDVKIVCEDETGRKVAEISPEWLHVKMGADNTTFHLRPAEIETVTNKVGGLLGGKVGQISDPILPAFKDMNRIKNLLNNLFKKWI